MAVFTSCRLVGDVQNRPKNCCAGLETQLKQGDRLSRGTLPSTRAEYCSQHQPPPHSTHVGTRVCAAKRREGNGACYGRCFGSVRRCGRQHERPQLQLALSPVGILSHGPEAQRGAMTGRDGSFMSGPTAFRSRTSDDDSPVLGLSENCTSNALGR
ncbi:hypothetical protein LX36DRAFT_445580 [Colletotrichum falcatum]|nr:hypothetical protein LX36DRAFT_445580 [Colletotrichum falcatum]